jgi:heme exporter protein CcmD
MTLFADPYAPYVIAAYAATALILGALIWSSVAASRRARRELDGLERERRR